MNRTLRILTTAALACWLMPAAAEDDATNDSPAPPATPLEQLLDGRAHLHARYRYEHVDDDLVAANDAHASTLRVALGWESGTWRGWNAFAEMEHVAQVGIDDYREGPGPVDLPNAGRYPVVADPPGTELNQAWARFTGVDPLVGKPLTMTIGRQVVTYRKAPLHRFVGNVLWRQNWQTFDAARLVVEPVEALEVDYAYVNQVNRIFGDDAPSPFDVFDCNCHLVNVRYGAFDRVSLEAYAYLLDVDNASANSTNTFGIRASGALPLGGPWKLLYAGEYAHQDDAHQNPADVDADYALGEAGLAYAVDTSWLKGLTFKVDYELLSGNGRSAFNTPLATGHAFQGWADRFLVTPPDGIEDLYLTAIAKLLGGALLVSYHMIDSDEGSYAYGDELDVQYVRPIVRHVKVGAKVAFYDADRNVNALARAGALPNNDVTKVWAWIQFDY